MDIEIYWSIIPDSHTAIGGLSSIKYCLETLRTASNDRSFFFRSHAEHGFAEDISKHAGDHLAQVWLTHSSGYSSNGLGPKTEMENAHVEIPISNYVLPNSASWRA